MPRGGRPAPYTPGLQHWHDPNPLPPAPREAPRPPPGATAAKGSRGGTRPPAEGEGAGVALIVGGWSAPCGRVSAARYTAAAAVCWGEEARVAGYLQVRPLPPAGGPAPWARAPAGGGVVGEPAQGGRGPLRGGGAGGYYERAGAVSRETTVLFLETTRFDGRLGNVRNGRAEPRAYGPVATPGCPPECRAGGGRAGKSRWRRVWFDPEAVTPVVGGWKTRFTRMWKVGWEGRDGRPRTGERGGDDAQGRVCRWGCGWRALAARSGGSRPVVYLAGRSLGRPAKAEAAPGGVRGEGRDAWPRGVGVALEGQG